MAAPVIEVDRLRKVYRLGEVDVEALRGVSLTIGPGEFVAVMGASGSGKSTLMNILGCLDRPTEGVYRLDGKNVKELNKDALAQIRRKKIGFVFQSYNLIPRMDAQENVELPMVYDGIAGSTRREQALEALRAVGLQDRSHHLPSQMSGGQQQRVAIARSIVNSPSLLLADEPTGNLDTASSDEIMGIFQGLNDERGITIVLVTHEPDIARFAKRVLRFRDGQLIQDEAVADREIYGKRQRT
ncbi:MAG TPA: ABC transporter ATP-binding protein [Candidatus Deferrimicrobiaceae bacterium]|nr:ABC transporter ATP-binding protein [Candidatus Deferrimicrobiaceae bacterium]